MYSLKERPRFFYVEHMLNPPPSNVHPERILSFAHLCGLRRAFPRHVFEPAKKSFGRGIWRRGIFKKDFYFFQKKKVKITCLFSDHKRFRMHFNPPPLLDERVK